MIILIKFKNQINKAMKIFMQKKLNLLQMLIIWKVQLMNKDFHREKIKKKIMKMGLGLNILVKMTIFNQQGIYKKFNFIKEYFLLIFIKKLFFLNL